MEIWQSCENSQPANFPACEISQPAKFGRLLNFATLLPCTPVIDCFLTRFFVVLYKSTLDVILVPLYIFVISLVLSTYVSSVKLVKSINFQSINHIIKLGAKFHLLRLLCDFLSISFTFFHFLTSQTPLDDEKSRDVWLKPPHPSRGRPLGASFKVN